MSTSRGLHVHLGDPIEGNGDLGDEAKFATWGIEVRSTSLL